MVIQEIVFRAAQCMILGWMLTASSPVAASTLVHSAAGIIFRSELNGTNVEEISNSGLGCFVNHLVIDAAQNRVYATEVCTNQFLTFVFWVSIEGTNFETLVIDFADSVLTGIVVDSMQDKTYFGVISGAIKRANLDGTNVETVVSDTGRVFGMALDPRSRLLYWAEFEEPGGLGRIRRFNIETGEVFDVVEGLGRVVDVAIDTVSNEIYLVDMNGKIQRTSLVTGGPVRDVLIGLTKPTRLALDLTDRKLYWIDIFEQKIQRANLDGSNREDVLTRTGLKDLDLIVGTVAIEARTWTQIKSSFR